MLQAANKKFCLLIVACVITVISVQIVWQTKPAEAVDEGRNMQSLLERWKKQTENEATIVSFKLITPLIQDGDLWIEVPFYNPDMDFDRNWGEIGADYICFEERGGQAIIIRCTPFSNISQVAYMPPI